MAMIDITLGPKPKPSAYIMIGAPGCGKSTRAARIKGDTNAIILSSDAYIEAKAQSEGKTYNEVFKKYIKEAAKHFEEELQRQLMYGEKDIIIDRTNCDKNARMALLAKLKDKYHVVAVLITRQLKWFEDVNSQRWSKGRDIPFHVTQNFISKLNGVSERTLKTEGFETIWTVSGGSIDMVDS